MLNIYDHDIPDILIYVYIYILDGIKQLSIYQTLSTYKYMHRLLYYIRIYVSHMCIFIYIYCIACSLTNISAHAWQDVDSHCQMTR